MDRIASAAGARVVVHDFHFQPLPDEEGFSVPPGYTTAISLQKVIYVCSRTANCEVSSSIVKRISFFYIINSQQRKQ